MKPPSEQNKELVLSAFDTLFNKRDYAAAEKFWSPHYAQHSAIIEPERAGLSRDSGWQRQQPHGGAALVHGEHQSMRTRCRRCPACLGGLGS